MIGILINPLSGKGEGRASAKEVKHLLSQEGFQVKELYLEGDWARENLVSFLSEIELLLLAAGDGTLMTVLPMLNGRELPVYMLPVGNESLFAREFSMTRNPALVLDSVRKRVASREFYGTVNDKPFFSMVSVGLDSQVIEQIAKTRGGTIRHWSYVWPTMQAAFSHQAPRINLMIDGENVIADKTGFLIIGNTKEYALRLRFVPEAKSAEGTLCARFFPYQHLGQYLAWCGRARWSDISKYQEALFFRGSSMKISVAGEVHLPVQADGEYVGAAPAVVEAKRGWISVLRP